MVDEMKEVTVHELIASPLMDEYLVLRRQPPG